MSSTGDIARFHWADYLVFALTLGISAAVGVFYAIKDRNKKSAETFLMADRKLHYVPMSISIFVSFISALSMLMMPVDVYSYGTLLYAYYFSHFVTIPITAHLFIPVLHRLKVKSIYEYLELRYNKAARIIASTIFVLNTLVYMAFVIYAPSLTFSQVTGVPIATSIICVGAVCTFYTALGGIKAVVWTDTIQSGLMLIGTLTVAIQTTVQLGGFSKVWEINTKGGRIIELSWEFFSFDPTIRYTFWGIMIGMTTFELANYGANQTLIQRYLAVKTTKDAQKAVYLNIPFKIIYGTIICYLGLAAYAYFQECDPFLSGKITKQDQLIPFLVMEVLGYLPGVPGLYVASIFSAALSTLSSGVNSLTVALLEDFIKPILKQLNASISAKKEIILSKILVIIIGLVTIGLSFAPTLMDKTLLQFGYSLGGILSGPPLGLMLLALVVPFSNSWGSISGLLIGYVITGWIGFGSILYPSSQPPLEFRTDGCLAFNATNETNLITWSSTLVMETMNATSTMIPSTTSTGQSSDMLRSLYSISFVWMGFLAVATTVISGTAISIVTNALGNRERKIHPGLVVHVFDKMCCCFPEDCRRLCRCGVQAYEKTSMHDPEYNENEENMHMYGDVDLKPIE